MGQRLGRDQFVSHQGHVPVGGVKMHRGLTAESVGVAHVKPGHGVGLAIASIDVQDDGPPLLLSHLVLPVVGLDPGRLNARSSACGQKPTCRCIFST